jgi:iron(III) transport system permease protein
MAPRALIGPAVLAYGIVALLPCLYMLGAGTPVAWRRMWLDSRQFGLLGNTLGLSFLASVAAVVFGALLALLIARSNLFGRRALFFVTLGQLLIPPHILAIASQQLLGNGFAGLTAAASVLAVSYYPLVFLIVIAGLTGIDPSQEEAALLARPRYSVLRSLTLPLLRPHLLAAFVLVFLLCVVEYGVPDLLRLNTYPVEIFAQFSAFYDEAAAAALCAPLLLFTFVLVAIMHRLIGERMFVPIRVGRETPRVILALGRARIGASAVAWLIAGAALVLPLLRMAYQVFASKRTIVSMLSAAPILSSVLLAAASATFIMALSFPMAYAAERAKPSIRGWILLMALLPLAVPATVIGIGLVRLWNRDIGLPIYGTTLMLVLGYAARFSPFAVVILAATVKQVNREQEEAVLLTSASWWRRVGRIVAPQCMAGLAAAWTITFVFCLGELGASLLLMPPGSETVTLRLFNLLHYGAHDVVSALSLTLVACGLIVCCVVVVLVQVGRRGRLWSV